jgi:hydroxymethylglutaryl-CoA synthase
MLKVGIDCIRMYTPPFSIDLRTIAENRGVDSAKYVVGLGQERMSVMPPDEDVVTMAAQAVSTLPIEDKQAIKLVFFATESGIDQSKAAGLYVHHLVGLSSSCRVVELKQACYSATCAIQMARYYLLAHPTEKVLVIASDNARYGLNTPGEPTQGCGAIAILLSAHPKLLVIEEHQGVFSEHVMDFWRPNYSTDAVVDGKYSAKVYLSTLDKCFQEYSLLSHHDFDSHARFCYHVPFSKMALKAHDRLSKSTNHTFSDNSIQAGLIYARQLGNAYTASLYIALASLLENDPEDLSNKRIGCFSYGSGSVGEFFSLFVQPTYHEALAPELHTSILTSRKQLDYRKYEDFFNFSLPNDGNKYETPHCTTNRFRFAGLNKHERLYTQTS